jgi:two-component system cell cycle response regulator DivK
MAGEAILVVDDNAANAALVSFILKSGGYDVRTAGDAPEALALLQGFTPRLIMMDLQLPGMDGLALTRQLKADPKTSGIVIVALTAYAMKGDEDRARQAGCDGYVTKPIDTRALPRIVSEFLATGESRRGSEHR